MNIHNIFSALYAGSLGLLFTSASAWAQSGDIWWDTSWNYRSQIVVESGPYLRLDRPVDIEVDFSQALTDVGDTGVFDPATIRVVEVDSSGTSVIDADVSFQFDPAENFDGALNATGRLIFLANGTTTENTARRFHVYFNQTGSGISQANVSDQVIVTDNVVDEGQTAIQIITPIASYFFHKAGAGISSLIDADGNDWIDYNQASGAAGEFRGIPNLVFPEGHLHPGATTASTTILNEGPLKATIESVTTDGRWRGRWEFYPGYARFTVLATDHDYWFLYEGTPGGMLEEDSDFVMRSDGVSSLLSNEWALDLDGDEWVYFADPNVGRSLFLANHSDDTAIDSYRPLAGLMTVFGFGRNGINSLLSEVPAEFTLSLVDSTDFSNTSIAGLSAYKPLTATVQLSESLVPTAAGIAVQPMPASVTEGRDAQLVVIGSGSQPLSYQWQEFDGVSFVDLPGETARTLTLPAVAIGEDDGRQFRVTVSNALGITTSESVALAVNEIDPTPVAVEDIFVLTTGATLSVTANDGVLVNDISPVNNTLNVALPVSEEATHGQLSVAADGSFTYQPDEDFVGIDSFTYRAVDGTNLSNVATSRLRVQADVSDTDALVMLSFNEGVGDTAYNSFRLKPDGELINGPVYVSDTADGSSNALNFDGNNDYVDLGTLDVDGSGLTLASWFNADSFTGNFNDSRLISKASGVSGNDHLFMLSTIRSDNDVRLRGRVRVDGVADTLVADSGNLVTGQWYHAAMTYDESELRLYLNGELVGSSNVSGPVDRDPSMPVAVAAQPPGAGGRHFHGSLDAIGIWQRALEASEISLLVSNEPAVNQPPLGVADSYVVNFEEQLNVDAFSGVLANDSDANGDLLSAVLIDDVTPASGNLTFNADGSFSFTPAEGVTGDVVFNYFVTDGTENSDAVSVTLTINPAINNAPIAVEDSYSTTIDSPLVVSADLGVLANDSDEDAGDILSAILEPNLDVRNGTLILNANGSFTYTPQEGFFGEDEFSYYVFDGESDSNIVEVTLTVENTGVDSNPDILVHLTLDDNQTSDVAFDSSINNNDGLITNATYEFDSGDGSVSSLRFDGNGSVNLGNLDATGNGLTLAAWVKADSFPGSNRDPRIISKARNATTNSHVFMLGTTRRGSSNDTVLRGRVRVRGVTRTFRANTGVLFPDVWYHVAMVYDESSMKLYLDGEEVASTGIFGPLEQDSASDVFVGANPSGGFNWDGNIDDVVIAQTPYSPEEIFALAASVPTVNLAPTAQADSYDVVSDTTLAIDAANGVLGNDSDGNGDSLTAVLIENVTSGELELNSDGSFTYIPPSGATGTYTFRYAASDGIDSSEPVTVSFSVASPVNQIPIALPDFYSTMVDTLLSVNSLAGVLVNDTDTDDTLAAVLVPDQNVDNGTLVLNDDGSFIYTPNDGFIGVDTFEYFAFDGELNSENVEVRISVTNPSTDPELLVSLPFDDHETATLATDSTVNGNDGVISGAIYEFESGDGSVSSLLFDGSGSVNLGPLDVDGSGLTLAAWVKADSFPGANRSPRIISKTRNISNNSHVFSLNTISRGSTDDTVLQARVKVRGRNTVTFRANTGFLETGVWYHTAMVFDGSSMKLYLDGIEIASTGVNGTVDQDDLSNVFVGASPSGGFGWDGNIDGVIIAEEAYTAEEIQVLASGLIAPDAVADSYNAQPDDQLVVIAESGVLANDSFPEQSNVQAILNSDVEFGELNLNPDGSFTYVPEPGFFGEDSFSYIAVLGSNSSSPATVTLNIFSPPIATDDTFAIDEDESLTVQLPGILQNDTDTVSPDNLSVALVTPPVNGTLLEFSDDGTFTYNPDSNFHGSDSFTYRAIDGGNGSSRVATVFINVDSVNDVPTGTTDQFSIVSNDVLVIDIVNDLIANDTDVDGDSLTLESFTQPASGALVDNNDGTLVYTPDASFDGTDIFEYRLTDGVIVSDPVTVQVNVISDPELLFSLLLDEGAGDVAVNNVPAQSDGQLVGGPSYSSDVPDGSDYSLQFDGIDDYIDLGAFDADGSGLTLALWFNAASFPGSQNDSRLISKATGVSGGQHIFMLSTIRSGSDTRLRARIRVAGVTQTLIASTGNLSTGVWYHAAMTYDENILSLYLDGVLVGSSSLSGPLEQAPEVPVAVAAQPPGAGGRYFHGNLDAIHIWQRAIDEAEVVALALGEPPAAEAPTIVTDLTSSNVSEGNTAQFTISSVGAAPLSYQWQEQRGGEFANLEGETNATLNLPAVQILNDNGRQFRVVISNAIGQVISSVATLNVLIPNDPPVASFIASTLSGVAPLNVNFDATASSDDQGIAEYEWNFGDGNSETITTSSINHTYDAAGSYTVDLTVRDAQGELDTTSQVVVVEQAPSAPVILIDPQDFTVVSGGDAQFGVLVIGTEPISYQWEEFNGAGFSPISGETGETLVLSEVAYPADNDRQFRVVLTNALGTTISEAATLTVTDTDTSDRVTADLEALYLFNSGSGDIIRDVAGAQGPLDLTITDPAAVNWLSGGGIEIVNPTQIVSAEPATEISNAIAQSGEISLEAWIKPANLTQNGPARIVTLSDGTLNRNVTLGQGVAGSDATRYDVRLRTTSTSNNGTPSLSTAVGSLTTELTHLVYSRDVCGISRTYVNGSLVSSGILPGDLSNWDRAYRLALGEEFNSTTRSWLGTYHLLAFYSQALGLADVQQNFLAGIDGLAAPAIVQGTRPFAAINATPTNGSTPLAVSFDASASSAPNGSIAQYIWDFGDGETDSGIAVDHTYTSGGCERASVTVTDNIGIEDSAALRIDPVSNGGGGNNGEARDLNWEVFTSTTSEDLPELPGTHLQQTSTLVFDINNDGVNDFVIGSRAGTGPLIHWYERTANGWNVHTVENDETLYLEAGAAHYDIDGDGDQDLVIGSGQLQENNALWWWENPYPNFTPGVSWNRRLIKVGGGRQHHDQLFGDFDNDGKAELVYWVNRDYALMFAEIPEDPTVEPWPATQIFTGNDFFPAPEGLASSDIDSDGIQDIVGAGYWFKHDGGTTFTPNLIDITQTFTRVATGQLIAGGRPEVVFDSGDAIGTLMMYEWDEQNLDWIATELLGRESRFGHSLNIGDMDRDGHLDIFSAEMILDIPGRTDAAMSILFGDSTGNFSLSEMARGIANHESKVADLDGDGDLDVLRKPFRFETPEVEVWLNQGRNAFNNWQRNLADDAVPWRTIFVEHGDIDNDGLEDIITGGWWWKNPGQINGNWTRSTIGAPLNQMAAVYDFDGDGDLDVLGTEARGSGANANFRWAENDGTGDFTIHGNVESAVGRFLQGVTVAEFEPGVLQVALSWQDGEGGLQLLTVPPAGSETTATWVWNAPGVSVEGEGLDHGDIDSDGDLDILAGTTWLRNDGPGQWVLLTLHNAVDQEADRNILVDMDFDGDLDALIGFGHDPLGTLAWYEQPSDPEALWTEHNIAFLGASAPQSVDVADIDGDGDLDVIAGEHQNPSVPGLRMLVFENRGSGIWNSHEVFAGDEHHDGGQLADFDGDGDLDIVSIGWLHRNLLIYENLER